VSSGVSSRLAVVERKLRSSDVTAISDSDLIEAMKSQNLDRQHIQALYSRIKRPLVASILMRATILRIKYEAGEPPPSGTIWPVLHSYAAHLSYLPGSAVPEYVPSEDPAAWDPPSLPKPNRRSSFLWMFDVHRWLCRCLELDFGREQLARTVARNADQGHFMADPPYMPILTPEESELLLDMVEPIESNFGGYGPVLAWAEPDGGLYTSQRSGHRWTEVDKSGHMEGSCQVGPRKFEL